MRLARAPAWQRESTDLCSLLSILPAKTTCQRYVKPMERNKCAGTVPVTLRCRPEHLFSFLINSSLLLKLFPGSYSKIHNTAWKNAERSHSGDTPPSARSWAQTGGCCHHPVAQGLSMRKTELMESQKATALSQCIHTPAEGQQPWPLPSCMPLEKGEMQ